MHAPLARHLACFSRLPAGASTAPPVPTVLPDASEPLVTMTVADFEARIGEVRDALTAEYARERLEAEDAHAQALAAATADATARRDLEAGAAIAQQIASAMQDLHDVLSEQIAKALRPLLAEAVAARAQSAAIAAVERVLADPDHPALLIRGPERLLIAVRSAVTSDGVSRDGVTLVADESVELSITGSGIHIETRIVEAIAALAAADGAA